MTIQEINRELQKGTRKQFDAVMNEIGSYIGFPMENGFVKIEVEYIDFNHTMQYTILAENLSNESGWEVFSHGQIK